MVRLVVDLIVDFVAGVVVGDVLVVDPVIDVGALVSLVELLELVGLGRRLSLRLGAVRRGRLLGTGLAPTRAGHSTRPLRAGRRPLGPPAGDALVRHAAHDDGHVRSPLADAGGPASGPGTPALEGGALVGETGRHVEVLGVEPVVVDGVGHGRVEQLAHDPGRLALGQGQGLGCPVDVLAADEVENLADLVRRDTAVAQDGTRPRSLVGLDPGHVSASRPALGRRGT